MDFEDLESFQKNPGRVMEEPLNQETEAEESLESMICDSDSRIVAGGFAAIDCKEEILLFVNAGGSRLIESNCGIKFLADEFFEGGDEFKTEEFISGGGDCSFIYQSARMGNFSYRIENLPAGDCVLDLHFAEIINTNGPKGMRVFNILDHFDIYSVVGSNRPLQLVGTKASIKENGVLLLRFEAPHCSNYKQPFCSNCSAAIEYPSDQENGTRMKSIARYEKTIQDLNETLQKKTDECYQSWISWSAANEQLEKVRMELNNTTFQKYSLDRVLEKQSRDIMHISSKYEHDKKSWTVAINRLDQKLKVMKREYAQLSSEAHECVHGIPDLNKMVFAVQELVQQCDNLKTKYNEEQIKRRKLHNQLQEYKGNIRVFCRCRPLNKSEVEAGCLSVVDFDAAKDGELGILSNGGGSNKKTFKFERVYTPKDGQVDVFADAAPMVVSVLDGYNVCIFAYGQTGTGKTFTMEGPEEDRGVNYRTLEELFDVARQRAETYTYTISVSVLEVYNEQIRDLLATETSSKKLEIKQDSEGFHHIPGIVEAQVENIQQVWNVLQKGSRARSVGSNNVNEHSSRSHCLLCIMVRAKNLISMECTRSKLWLVDLAGSERLAKTDVQGERLKEAQNINRSLSALGDVISALANKSSHIPYSPADRDSGETLSSLNFATRVRGVELGPARKQIDTSELQKMRIMLEKAKHESKSKEEALRKLEESMHNLESTNKTKDQAYKNQLDKTKELENRLELTVSAQSQAEKQVSLLSEMLKAKDESRFRLQQEVTELEKKLKERNNEIAAHQKTVTELENKLSGGESSVVPENKVHATTTERRSFGEYKENMPHHMLPLQRLHHQGDAATEDQPKRQTTTTTTTTPSSRDGEEGTEHRILRRRTIIRSRRSSFAAPAKENEPAAAPPEAPKKTRLSTRSSRQSDPPPPNIIPRVARIVTGAKTTVAASQSRFKTSRNNQQGMKEKDEKKRMMWSR
ncbi:hypothetical protein M569_08803 [Genlisea aurea]|uniref:Kinesin-like protein n=1 Tax=Genlisea aurea TaxID=192259 RepID=S8DS76_9LAMI|nr:hypothetical protein M569_08803 [Genlisea aurea]